MRKIFLNILFVTSCIMLNAQSFCYNGDYDYENVLSNMETSFVQYNGPYQIRVYFHIIQKTDGTGAYSFPSSYIPLCMQTLNSDYSPHNIFFEYAGLDYIYNTNYYEISDLGSTYYNMLINTNSHSNAIDIYLLPTNTSLGGRASGIPGRALAIGGTMEGIVLGSSHVLSHEIGHCLGLFHTFHGTYSQETGTCAELVNGSNCTNCGDFVCDTPADPFPLFGYLNAQCLWDNLNVTDANGHLYAPDTKQIMAYVSPNCMEHLSDGQGERMRAHIATQQILQERTIGSVEYIQNRTFLNGQKNVITAFDSVIAGNNVTSGNTGNVNVQSGSDVVFEAGGKILLKKGFRVNSGGNFEARIRTFANGRNHVPQRENMDGYMPLLENTSWTTISYGFEPPLMAREYKYVGDTLIGEHLYKIIKMFDINVDDAIVYPDVNPNISRYYLYEDVDNRRVFQYNTYYKRDMLLYDFSVQIGEKMPKDSLSASSIDTLFTLKDISTLENSGYTRKQYIFTSGNDSIVWIEGIGNITDFTIPYSLKRFENSRILCVQQGENTVYDTGIFRSYICDDIKKITEDSRSSIEDTKSQDLSASKIIRNGQILIIRNNKTFTITGTELTSDN